MHVLRFQAVPSHILDVSEDTNVSLEDTRGVQKGLSEGKPARSPGVVVKLCLPMERRCALGHRNVCSFLGQGIALVSASLGCSSSGVGRGSGQDEVLNHLSCCC